MSRLLCRMMSIEKRFFIMAPTREDELNVSFLESWLSNLGCQTWGVVLSHDNYSKSVFESYNALHHLIFCCAVCLLYYYIIYLDMMTLFHDIWVRVDFGLYIKQRALCLFGKSKKSLQNPCHFLIRRNRAYSFFDSHQVGK